MCCVPLRAACIQHGLRRHCDCDGRAQGGRKSSLRRWPVEVDVICAVRAEEPREALVHLDLERLEWIRLSIDGEVAGRVEGLDAVRLGLVIVLLCVVGEST